MVGNVQKGTLVGLLWYCCDWVLVCMRKTLDELQLAGIRDPCQMA